jgi:hypothetical protein
VAARQIDQDRRHAVAAEEHRRAHAQAARGLAAARLQRGLAGLQLGERAHAALVERLPVLGQALAAGRAVEEAHAEPLLQPADGLAHRRPREAEPLGGEDEAPGFRGFDEGGHAAQAISHGARL